MSRELVSGAIDLAVSGIRLDGPEDWLAFCTPPCDHHHNLADTVPDHEDGPVFVMQPRKDPTPGSTTGIVVCGHSRLTTGTEAIPIFERLNPRLAAMTLSVILTADLPTTISEICYNRPRDATSVKLPLLNDGVALHLDAGRVQPVEIDLAMLCLA